MSNRMFQKKLGSDDCPWKNSECKGRKKILPVTEEKDRKIMYWERLYKKMEESIFT